ncbi:MAG: hypothetical protein M3312_04990 [Actinomycetota bacterium]|nr:hypothetical protein [Actinomycetota bacterium]
MNTVVLRIFQHEVALQCKFIVSAAHDLNAAMVIGSTDEVWKHLQIILVASANLSKMFWGSRGKREAARKRLRDSLAVPDDSPLRDANLRNDFEHFDERLESWYQASEHRNYVGRGIGPPSGVAGAVETDRFQNFDHTTGVVTFWGHSVSVNEVVEEANRILPIAQVEAREPPWDED